MKDYKSLIKESMSSLIIGLMLLIILGSSADTIVYISNAEFFLVYINLALVVILLGTSMLVFFKYVSLPFGTYVFTYTTIGNVVATNLYLIKIDSPVWEMSFLRDVSVVFIFTLFICLVLEKKDLIIYLIFIVAYHGVVYFLSTSSFISQNIIVILITIIGGASLILWLVNLMKKILIRNQELELVLKEKNDH